VQNTIKVNLVEFFSGFSRSCQRHGIDFAEERLRFQMFVKLREVSMGIMFRKRKRKLKQVCFVEAKSLSDCVSQFFFFFVDASQFVIPCNINKYFPL